MSHLITAAKTAIFSPVATFLHTHLHGGSNTSLEPPLFERSPGPFPREIIETIVDHLHDNKPALAACSLTSFSFNHPSQKLLYSEIKLSTLHFGKILQLHLLLMHNPRLSTYIRTLAFSMSRYSVPKSKELRMVLRMLSHVRSLTISYEGLPISKPIPKRLRCAILDLARSQNTTKLVLCGLQDFQISELRGGGQLHELHLKGVTPPFRRVTRDYPPTKRRWIFFKTSAPPAPALVQVQHLYIDCDGHNSGHWIAESVADVRESICLSQLRALHITHKTWINLDGVNECQKLLEQCPEPVKPFDLRMFSFSSLPLNCRVDLLL